MDINKNTLSSRELTPETKVNIVFDGMQVTIAHQQMEGCVMWCRAKSKEKLRAERIVALDSLAHLQRKLFQNGKLEQSERYKLGRLIALLAAAAYVIDKTPIEMSFENAN